MRSKTTVAIALGIALILALGTTGTAVASHLIGSAGIRDNSIRSRDIQDGTIKPRDLSPAAVLSIGLEGPVGPPGAKGAKGDSGLTGAYYSVAFYDVGDTNAGAIATVACKAQTDVAISGGVQVMDFSKNTPVSSSFPGRMDWSTNTPKAGRLDGWIVQFGGNAGATSDKDPQSEKIWALCVPGANIPVNTTYTQSVG